MDTKKCRLCEKEKPLDCFYKGLRQCKPCYKEKVIKHRNENIDHYRQYDRERGNRQDKKYFSEYRKMYPNKYKAHTIVGNAIRDGKLFKEPCVVCGEKDNVHAHHDDYLKPLNVRWLCSAHHSQWHRDNGEANNP